MVTRVSTYRLDSYGPPAQLEPPEGGIFQLSEASWRLVFEPPRAGVSCGLFRSRVEVQTTRRGRRCRVTVAEVGGHGFEATFVLRARADAVRADLDRRHRSLDRAAEVVAAVEKGEWWRGTEAFDALGWSATRSLAGVRCIGGDWETDGLGPTRRARVLDFGRGGVSLRGWRTRLRFPWDRIVSIEVTDGTRYSDGNDVPRGGTVVVLKSHAGEQIIFHTALATPDEVAAELRAPIDRLVRRSGDDPYALSPASVPIAPAAVPEMHVG